MNFAVMSGNTVSNVIVADSKENAELATNSTCVEYTEESPAGIGYSYNEAEDIFITPQPYPSWLMDSGTYLWNAPIPMPVDGAMYSWVEADLNWQLEPTE